MKSCITTWRATHPVSFLPANMDNWVPSVSQVGRQLGPTWAHMGNLSRLQVDPRWDQHGAQLEPMPETHDGLTQLGPMWVPDHGPSWPLTGL